MTIAVINEKGGVGKTTTVVTLARLWSEQSPLVLDIDRQQATESFADELEGCEVRLLKPGQVGQAMRSAGDRPVLIDCPAYVDIARPALEVADLVMVPIEAEFLALRATQSFVAELEARHKKLAVAVVLTMFVASDADSRDIRDAAAKLFKKRLCETVIARHGAIRKASTQGLTVIDYAPFSAPARQYRRLAEEIAAWQETRRSSASGRRTTKVPSKAPRAR